VSTRLNESSGIWSLKRKTLLHKKGIKHAKIIVSYPKTIKNELLNRSVCECSECFNFDSSKTDRLQPFDSILIKAILIQLGIHN